MKSFANALLVSSWAAPLVGPNTAPAFRLESIGEAVAERRFGSDDGQIDPFAIDEPNHGVGVQYVDRRGGNGAGDAGVAGRADDVGDVGFVGELPGQGVLARAGAQDEDPHDAKRPRI